MGPMAGPHRSKYGTSCASNLTLDRLAKKFNACERTYRLTHANPCTDGAATTACVSQAIHGAIASACPYFIAWPRDMARRHRRLSACARKLTLPALLMRGERSDVVSEAGANEFLALCPHAEYFTVQDAGHCVGKGNELFAAAALRFIERHTGHGHERPRTRRLYERA
jgi:pimeloyl-ACP methyl ester carboxylesterase